VGGERAGAAEMIFLYQFPEMDHFTPDILGDRNHANAWNRFFR
jgi:hypothetical protein